MKANGTAGAPSRAGWTTVGEMVAVLERRWSTGRYLKAYALGENWSPVSLPVKGPAGIDVLERLDAVREWVGRFERDSVRAGEARFSVERGPVRGRVAGANYVPHRVVVDTFEQLCELLGKTGQVRTLDSLLALTEAEVPALVTWAKAHPLLVLENSAIWQDLLATMAWMLSNSGAGLYLRHIDVAGVDTKFVERNDRLLGQLLVAAMPEPARAKIPARASFAARFGYLTPPSLTRLRLLDPEASPFGSGVTEIAMRTTELAERPLAVRRVFVVENEVTYLAFPAVADAAVIFGSGFDVTSVLSLPWLAEREVIYWGDVDTHGFAILDQLRRRWPGVTSMLMDDSTLLAHRKQWVEEPVPTARELEHLTPEEAALYRDLVEDRYGRRVRLEQERVRFGLVRAGVAEAVSSTS